ncbi:MAG: phosphatase PAP2 family protein [Flavobacteriales bacterium]|nr:phosphatase PAP2 family protein [Flavobacteriales bacterium]
MLNNIKYIVTSVCLFGIVYPTIAQEDTGTHYNQQNCKYCLHGEHQNGSPYTINFKNEIPYFAASLGLLGTGLILRDKNEETPFTAEELNSLNPTKINSFDRGAIYNNSASARKYSNYTLLSGALLPFYFLSNHHTKKDFFPLLIMGAEVFSITSTLTLNAKYTFNRTRPLAYNATFSDELRTDKTSRLSFFSGHTAQTAGFSFFMAKVITDYHPNMRMGTKIGIWSFAIALPAVTGYFRVKGGKHFNTDVITGFVVGGAIGWLVPHLHKKRNGDSKLSMNPFNYNGATGLSLTLKLD